jgi:hypothetical protein
MVVRLSAPHAGHNLTPRKIPGTHFCERLSRPHGHSAAGRIRSIKKSNDLIGNRIHDLLACSIVPQPTMLPHAMTITHTPIVIKEPVNLLLYYDTH